MYNRCKGGVGGWVRLCQREFEKKIICNLRYSNLGEVNTGRCNQPVLGEVNTGTCNHAVIEVLQNARRGLASAGLLKSY